MVLNSHLKIHHFHFPIPFILSIKFKKNHKEFAELSTLNVISE